MFMQVARLLVNAFFSSYTVSDLQIVFVYSSSVRYDCQVRVSVP